MIVVPIEPTFASFRNGARAALARNLGPGLVKFVQRDSAQTQLSFVSPDSHVLTGGREAQAHDAVTTSSRVPRVSKTFLSLGERVAVHRDTGVWDALYRVLFRLTHGEPRLLEVATDRDVRPLSLFDAAVRRDVHKMHAFVRFREARARDGESVWVAFYEPDHRVADRAAPLFVDRFGGTRFVLATPDVTLFWNTIALQRGPGSPDEAAARAAFDEDTRHEDGVADLFRTYYESIFNPARVNPRAMRAEMPVRFWKHLPEAQSVPRLLKEATERKNSMIEPRALEPRAEPPIDGDTTDLARAALSCAVCTHSKSASQTVFGQGPTDARLFVVGEQPGDEEDLKGLPFVGPAGRFFDSLLAEAGVLRERLYLTNAVKHFTWEPRGKRRLHVRPHASSVRACRPWLDAELARVRPKVILCLGTTAAQSFLGPGFRLNQALGKWLPQSWAEGFLVSYHPSAILRMPEGPLRDAARAVFINDLVRASALAESDGTRS